ncbi:nucleoside transporter-domain-containing protein [Gymnopilus junonius]|uniref:Nucleoside transporter-domain-containing protein n=1 Tax=Gymnopilus junonius TaxID=109634 RepID=A0A9P5P408_GYMJU|nr:nucleoside transporter-domain-containing protein [Gymnopilus junonius]
MSSSLGSPEALYHAIPQLEEVNASQINLDSDTLELNLAPTDPPAFLIDSSIRWIHFVLGCAVLLSWNVVITAMPFFASRLAHSSLRSTFASYLTTTFTLANLIVLAHATATSKHTIPSRRTRSAIAWLTLLNFLLTLTTFFTPSPGIFFAFILFNGAAQATAGAYLQTSVIAVASLFGPPAVQSLMSGQAAVAVAVSGVQVISAYASVHGKPRTFASDGSAEERSAYWFFSLSTLFLLFSLVAHTWMIRMPVYQHVAVSLETERKTAGDVGHEEERRGLVSSPNDTSLPSDRQNAIRVARLNISYEVAVAYVFVVTLVHRFTLPGNPFLIVLSQAVFPPITTSVQPTNLATHPLLFSAVHFLVFNIGDFLGRYVCSFPAFLVWSAKRLLTLSAARTLFIPIFLMCNIQRGPTAVDYNPIINSDLLFMLILFFFGCSNGYVSSLCMMSAPSLEHNPRLKGRPEDVDVAATVASFCLVGGLTAGSVASFAVKAVFCSCNPFMD